MSDPVLSQLATVENDLAKQFESLTSQLTAIQEQRKGLRIVIDMFQESDHQTTGETASDADAVSFNKPPATSKVAKRPVKETSVNAAPAQATTSKATTSKTTKSKTTNSKTTKSKSTALKPKTQKSGVPKNITSDPSRKPDPKKQKDGRAADWQKYVQADYEDTALPEAVSIVLRSQPSKIFTIADVMSSIFSEDMSRVYFLKARNRISNILSAGARDGTWYRGSNGRYSQSESVTKQ